MEFKGFDWDSGNRDKCQKHGVSIAEIEGLFAKPVLVLPDSEMHNPNPHAEVRAKGRCFAISLLR